MATTKRTKKTKPNGVLPGAAPTMDALPSTGEQVYVAAIDTNVKGGARCGLSLKTLLFGRNGTGKSTVIQGIDLALSGAASDLQGRDLISQSAALMSLHPARSGELVAKTLLSNGTVACFTVEGDTASAKKPEHLLPPVVDPTRALPLRAVRKAITEGSADTVRQFLLRHVCGKVTLADVVERFPKPLHVMAKRDLENKIRIQECDALTALLEVAVNGKKRSSDLNKEADTLRALPAPSLPQPTKHEIEVSQAQVANARAGLEASSRAQNITAMASKVVAARTRKSQLEEIVVEERDELVKIDAQIKEVEGRVPPIPEEFSKAKDLIELMLRRAFQPGAVPTATSCYLCGGNAEPAVLDERHKKLHDLFASREKLQEELEELREKRLVINASFIQCSHELAGLAAALTDVPTVDPSVPPIEEARKLLNEAEAHAATLNQTIARWEATRVARDQADEKEAEAGNWEKVSKAAKFVIEELLDTAKSAFEARVQRYLPADDRFFLQLHEGTKAVCRYGFMRDTTLHTALSGAEWARLTIAMACACAEGGDGTIRVVIPMEDRWIDSETLYTVLEAFGAIPYQVIYPAAAMPTRNGIVKIPPGWTVINTDAGEHKSAQLPASKQAVG
jgi:hypothetical protein